MSHYVAAAMAALLLAAVALGAWDLTTALYARTALQGALLAVQPQVAATGGVDAAAQERVRQVLAAQGLDPSRATLTARPVAGPGGRGVEVTLSYRARLIHGAVDLAVRAWVPAPGGNQT